MKRVKALVLTGYGLNCDYETDYALSVAGADSQRVHINELIKAERVDHQPLLAGFHILVFGGGFSWADDHGAGVLLANRVRYNIGSQIDQFIADGKIVIGICNGFQALVNLGLLPGFDGDYHSRQVALTVNDCGNFRDQWVTLKVLPSSCTWLRDLKQIDLPVRHGEGKFFADEQVLDRLFSQGQVVFQYAGPDGGLADGVFPHNPNGSLRDIAGICDTTGRVLGMMPHPEAFNHVTNHPDWTRLKETLRRSGQPLFEEGLGIKIFRNAVTYLGETVL
ncbi:MAG TPA: phosphoribosylformylglycinamidine synthase I [Thermodesulfobacteriota bacterium]|nr:phosphoribosylformylglycinamidine synthase I [Thermodesulfobacteriota bacterium]